MLNACCSMFEWQTVNKAELNAVTRILEARKEYEREMKTRGVLTWVADSRSSILPIRRNLSAANTFNVSQHQNKAAAAEQRESTVERNNEAQERADELLVQQVHERQRRLEHRLEPICGTDEIIFRVYCADHTYTTLRTRVDSTAAHIKLHAASKLGLSDKHRDLVLVQVKSNGERLPYDDTERNVATNLSVNGRLFVAPVDHIDALTPLPEQDLYQHRQGKDTHALLQALVADRNDTGLTTGTPMGAASKLDEFSSQDVAYCLTQMAWSLVDNVHEYELLYSVLATRPSSSVAMQALAGSSSSSSLGPGGGGPPVTANLNILLRHFNELQYWVVTEICLCQSVSKRVQILRKFIKIAAHCKELQNLNAFFAIIMGLSNMAVARLNATWERLTSKLKRTFSQFESLIDPSRNHRRYRLFIAKMTPPIIPFMPLLLKDMTFAHDGNKTYLDNGLTNFEKMQMIAQTLRTIRYCKSRPMRLHPSQCKTKTSLRSIEMFFRDLKVIDNQRTLSQLSHSLEHRKP
ncbi:Rap guanine nucleotide exchange factor 4 [Fragariocoptes setiger]|uniref:Rap guanine nucleotide exchange factor 4 n=1 Tax=Fragariocoptes setiger TaxID=1670756 RepID=A0ABQ7S6A6_9ACAR|nr:Rap guanine nucleotide exchange factor 4 [Fragariocoptes setiger]